MSVVVSFNVWFNFHVIIPTPGQWWALHWVNSPHSGVFTRHVFYRGWDVHSERGISHAGRLPVNGPTMGISPPLMHIAHSSLEAFFMCVPVCTLQIGRIVNKYLHFMKVRINYCLVRPRWSWNGATTNDYLTLLKFSILPHTDTFGDIPLAWSFPRLTIYESG